MLSRTGRLVCGCGVGGVCSWRDGASVRARQLKFGMGRGGVVSGERGVVGGNRMEGGSEGRGCGEWVRDGRLWECDVCVCVCVCV
jgi:hypothetical protein